MEPSWSDGPVTVYSGDCRNVMAAMEPGSVDAVVCDPPYDLTANKKGGSGAASLNEAHPAGRSRITTGGGFMGREWDATGVAFDPATWRAVLRVLKPGGHVLAFGATRTYHRLACAVEDAGLEVRDSLHWIYGSGFLPFPKSHDVSKAIDKRPGVSRHAEFARHLASRREAAALSRQDVSEKVVGTRSGACWNWEHHQFPEARWWPVLRDLLGLDGEWGPVIAEAERTVVGERTTGIGSGRGGVPVIGDSDNRDVTAPATEDAARWSGWGSALKPAHEPIVMARKPLTGTLAANVLAHGTGAINVDGCRVATSAEDAAAMERANTPGSGRMKAGSSPIGTFVRSNATGAMDTSAGRWPPNILLGHSLDCNGECVPARTERRTVVRVGALRITLEDATDEEISDAAALLLPRLRRLRSSRTEDIRTPQAGAQPHAPQPTGSQGSPAGYPSCARCGDGRAQFSGGDGLAEPRQLADALEHVLGRERSLSSSPTSPCGGHLSSSGDSPGCATSASTHASKTPCPSCTEPSGPGTASRTASREATDSRWSLPLDSTSASSTSAPSCTRGTPDRNARKYACTRCLVALAAQACSPSSSSVAVEYVDLIVPGCPVAEMDAQSGIGKSGEHKAGEQRHAPGGNGLTHGSMAGAVGMSYPDTGGASRFFPCFRYEAKAPARERPRLPDGTAWPTVKPLALMRWLVRLVTPPDGTVLDPFAGTGTTGEACALEGFRCVLIERDPVALELIRTRLGKPVPAGQDALF